MNILSRALLFLAVVCGIAVVLLGLMAPDQYRQARNIITLVAVGFLILGALVRRRS